MRSNCASNSFCKPLFGGPRRTLPMTASVSAMMVIALTASALAQQNAAQTSLKGLPEDWSNSHVVYGPVKTGEPSPQPDDPRKRVQDLRHAQPSGPEAMNAYRTLLLDTQSSTNTPLTVAPPSVPVFPISAPAKKPAGDWSYFLGATSGATVQSSNFPAKFTFDTNAAPSCSNDFAVFALNQAGSTHQPSIIAFNQLYAGATATASAAGYVTTNGAVSGSTVTVNGTTISASIPTSATATVTVNCSQGTGCASTTTDASLISHTSTLIVGGVTYTFIATGSYPSSADQILNTTTSGSSGPDANLMAQNIEAAINANASECGTTHSSTCFGSGTTANPDVTATVSGNVITLTAITAGSGGNSNTESCVTGGNTGTFNLDGTTTCNSTSFTGGGGGTVAGQSFAYSGLSTSQLATNLATAIGGVTGISSASTTASGQAVTVTASTAGIAGNSIALSANLPGFSWGSSTLLGGANAGICGSNPSLIWTYDSAPTPVLTSPVLSGDGTKVAFIEKGTAGSGNGAVLHVLRWKSGDNTSTTGSTFNSGAPSTSTSTASTYTTCLNGATSCEFLLKYSTHSTTANTNSQSSPYYDYTHDVLYVGDDDGYLYKIANVFSVAGPSSTPSVAWSLPVTSTSGCLNLSSPVYDYGTTNVFVPDSCGQLAYVTTGSTPALGGTLSGSSSPKIYDSPIVDSANGKVYSFFANWNGSEAAVVQTTTASPSSPVVAPVGTNSGTVKMHMGAPDNNYYNLPSSNFPGYIYVCGNPGGTAANLYRIGFTSGTTTMSTTPTSLLSLSTTAEECSPPTEIFNNGSNTDWLAVGIPANCAFAGLTGGCILAFNISGFQPSTAYSLNQQLLDSNGNLQTVTTAGTSAGTAPGTWGTSGTTVSGTVTFTYAGALTATGASSAPGGASGIIVDNVSGNVAAPAFQNNHAYTYEQVITDGTNLEEVTVAGTSQTSGTPSWNTTVGGTTTSGSVTFTNIGPAYSHTSSFYYGTLAASQACGTTGGGSVSGCAVNRTQSGLQ